MVDRLKENSETDRGVLLRPKSKWTTCFKFLLALAVATGVILGSYNVLREAYRARRILSSKPKRWINLEEGQNTAPSRLPAAKEKTVLRVALAPIVSPEKLLESYQGLIEYLAEKLDRKPIPLFRPTNSETNDLVRYQGCEIAVVGIYPFVRGEREFGMQALAEPKMKGATADPSFIIVPESSPAKSLFDLQGKRFASSDIISTTGWLYPAMVLMEAGKDPYTFFGEHVLTGSHDKALQAVLDRFVDGASIDGIVFGQMVAKDPSILKQVKILSRSAPFGVRLIVARPDIDPDLRRAIVSVLLDMHNDPNGSKILKKLGIERFVIPENGLFNRLRQAIAKLEGWK
jgi:phosphonate transport system substrate-binding protein